MKGLGLPFLIICFLSGASGCKTSNAIENRSQKPENQYSFSPFEPFFNNEVLKLSGWLYHHKKTYKEWPASVADLQNSTLRDSLKLDICKFRNLGWTSKNDSVFVNFTLHYCTGDAGYLDFLRGNLILFVEQDSVLNFRYFNIQYISHDGLIERGGKNGSTVISGSATFSPSSL